MNEFLNINDIQNAMDEMMNIRIENEEMSIKPNILSVPPELEDAAHRILETVTLLVLGNYRKYK